CRPDQSRNSWAMRAIDYFDKGADTYPDRTAIVDANTRYSYMETRLLTERIARAMRACGLANQERAAIYSPNDARALIVMLGILRAGAVWVPINYRNGLEAIIAYMNYAGVSWLFYHTAYANAVGEIKAGVPTLKHLICLDGVGGIGPSLVEFMELGSEVPDH